MSVLQPTAVIDAAALRSASASIGMYSLPPLFGRGIATVDRA
jgi:hypothetical protein